MNQKLIIFFLLIVLSSTISCRKYNQGYSPVYPSAEKKWTVTTVAGDGRPIFQDGPASNASFRDPLDVAVAEDGTIYVADVLNHRIRKIAGGQVITFAGSGVSDTTGGIGISAAFRLPDALAIDNTGNLYTLDVTDPRVRKISPEGLVTRYAGSGVEGFADGRADIAQFGEETSGIAIDDQGNIYISDLDNSRIRKISVSGDVTTVAGNGKAGYVDGKPDIAQFFSPTGIVVDNQGNLFVADMNRVRKITASGVVSTFAGGDSAGYRDGQPRDALFSFIQDMVMDKDGNIYLSDGNRIRRITPQGIVSTLAGSSPGYQDGDAASAKFFSPTGLGIDKQGNIYVADLSNHRIRKISLD
ncbi:MAG TPA: NHL repeat-containing protein [Chitinophagaceae bacterium]|jgi:sugar lactone lactonase YvrE|nr:NHL repeat-containing protein [Chitinophagaceae bacterium]